MLDVRPSKRRDAPFWSLKGASWKWLLYALYLGAAGLLAAGGLAVYKASPRESTTNREMISAGQGFVRNAIREELKTSFAGDEETRVEVLPDHKFLIAGWVDIISATGETDRQDYSCVIYKTESDGWVGEKISVIPQHL